MKEVTYYRCGWCGRDHQEAEECTTCEDYCKKWKRSGTHATGEGRNPTVHTLQEPMDIPKGEKFYWSTYSLCGLSFRKTDGAWCGDSYHRLHDGPATCKTCLKLEAKNK